MWCKILLNIPMYVCVIFSLDTFMTTLLFADAQDLTILHATHVYLILRAFCIFVSISDCVNNVWWFFSDVSSFKSEICFFVLTLLKTIFCTYINRRFGFVCDLCY